LLAMGVIDVDDARDLVADYRRRCLIHAGRR
jgi:hypothetical protein